MKQLCLLEKLAKQVFDYDASDLFEQILNTIKDTEVVRESRTSGGKTLCNTIGCSKLRGDESQEGPFSLAESSRVT